MKPWGHAVAVDSFAQQPANLTTSTWTTLRVDHMSPRPATTFQVHFKDNDTDVTKGGRL